MTFSEAAVRSPVCSFCVPSAWLYETGTTESCILCGRQTTNRKAGHVSDDGDEKTSLLKLANEIGDGYVVVKAERDALRARVAELTARAEDAERSLAAQEVLNRDETWKRIQAEGETAKEQRSLDAAQQRVAELEARLREKHDTITNLNLDLGLAQRERDEARTENEKWQARVETLVRELNAADTLVREREAKRDGEG
jgi:hypothetical protein